MPAGYRSTSDTSDYRSVSFHSAIWPTPSSSWPACTCCTWPPVCAEIPQYPFTCMIIIKSALLIFSIAVSINVHQQNQAEHSILWEWDVNVYTYMREWKDSGVIPHRITMCTGTGTRSHRTPLVYQKRCWLSQTEQCCCSKGSCDSAFSPSVWQGHACREVCSLWMNWWQLVSVTSLQSPQGHWKSASSRQNRNIIFKCHLTMREIKGCLV